MTHHNRWQLAGPHDAPQNAPQGAPLFGNTHLPSGEAKGVIVLCHGFKGYKDYGFFPQLAERCAQAGLIAHRFNFAFSGMTHDTTTFAKPELFEHDRWMSQVDDLLSIVDRIDDNSLPGAGLPLTVLGHSRGGLTAILAAEKLGERLSTLITAAAVADPLRVPEDQQQALLEAGRLPIESARTGQTLYVGKQWLQEILDLGDALNPVRAMGRVSAKTQIIHGDADPTVPASDAHALAAANPAAQVVILPDANHVFDAPNPLGMDETPPPNTQAMIDSVIAFAAKR